MKKIFAMMIVALSVTSTTQSVLANITSSTNKIPATQQNSPYNWTSGYFGLHAGGALGIFDVSNPYGRSIYGDTIRVPSFIGGIQAGYNWQAPATSYVLGVEAELSGLYGEGTNTCFAFSDSYISANAFASADFTAKLTGRFGTAFGPANRILCYIKGGAVFLNTHIEVTNNNLFLVLPPKTTNSRSSQWGYTIGAGLEFAISPALSMKLEYNYLALANTHVHAPPSIFVVDPELFVLSDIPGLSASVSENMHQILLGFNYHVWPCSENDWPSMTCYCHSEKSSAFLEHVWQLETGVRYLYSQGRFQQDLPSSINSTTSLVSRLTYSQLGAHACELFGRLDSEWAWFAKGLVGAGFIAEGHMNDEDWGIPIPDFLFGYMNTFSHLDITKLNYATIDIGYNFLSGSDYRLGIFAGYNQINERYTSNDLKSIASDFAPTLANVRVITETDKWQAVRVGLTVQAWLSEHWRLDLDLAYLPYIKLDGEDDHWLRNLVINEQGFGRGLQLEAAATYCFNPQARMGVGARYWAAWTYDGSGVDNGEFIDRVDTYRYERFGFFVEGSYLFG